MKRLLRNISSIAPVILLFTFISACTGVQAPLTTQLAPPTLPTSPSATEKTVPVPTDSVVPTLTATLLPPTEAPDPSGTTPKPDLAQMTVRVFTSTSPDGQWKAEALLADPYTPQGTFVGDMDYASLTVFRTDGSIQMVPYEEWSPTGLGDSYLSGLHWSTDGRYLYFTHNGAADGCGTPFVTNVRRVDLQDGSMSEIPLEGIGLDVVTFSPEVDRLAYRTDEGFLLYGLESGEARRLAHEWPEGFDYLVGGYAWSPDGEQLAFTITHNYCGPGEALTSIQLIDLESRETRTLTDHDPRMLHVTGWPEPDRLQVVDREGQKHFLTIETGDLQSIEATPDPVAQATQVLIDFLDALNLGASDSSQYERAAALYGGSFGTLVEINPGVDPEDQATLLRNACRVNGFQCLRFREVLSAETVTGAGGSEEVRLTVNLMSPDGSIFARGQCCGEETGEPETEFVFTVKQDESGEFKVLELPPYVP